MPADRLHLVRHGEVDNPQGVLYGRLPHFALSAAGREMAQHAADYIVSLHRPVTLLVCSPLQRTRESIEPFEKAFGLTAVVDERVIEPTNVFEGRKMRKALRNPLNWRFLRAPARPSWGEPYKDVVARMTQAMRDAWDRVDGGDVVIVSHQLPIWITHLALSGEALTHDPRNRRCALSSVTSFEWDGQAWHEMAYAEPASTEDAVDVGAV